MVSAANGDARKELQGNMCRNVHQGEILEQEHQLGTPAQRESAQLQLTNHQQVEFVACTDTSLYVKNTKLH